jgi:hypothetical protein
LSNFCQQMQEQEEYTCENTKKIEVSERYYVAFYPADAALDLPVTSLLWSSSHHSGSQSKPGSRRGASKAHFIICQEKKCRVRFKIMKLFSIGSQFIMKRMSTFPFKIYVYIWKIQFNERVVI